MVVYFVRFSTTFFDHMFGCWILIGLQKECCGITTGVVSRRHSDWLITVTWARPNLACYVYSEIITDCDSIALQVTTVFSFIYMVEVVEKQFTI